MAAASVLSVLDLYWVGEGDLFLSSVVGLVEVGRGSGGCAGCWIVGEKFPVYWFMHLSFC